MALKNVTVPSFASACSQPLRGRSEHPSGQSLILSRGGEIQVTQTVCSYTPLNTAVLSCWKEREDLRYKILDQWLCLDAFFCPDGDSQLNLNV